MDRKQLEDLIRKGGPMTGPMMDRIIAQKLVKPVGVIVPGGGLNIQTALEEAAANLRLAVPVDGRYDLYAPV